MAIRLNQSEPGFEARFAAFLASKREVSVEVDDVVRAIIAKVRADGDAALIDYTQTIRRGDLESARHCGLEGTTSPPPMPRPTPRRSRR